MQQIARQQATQNVFFDVLSQGIQITHKCKEYIRNGAQCDVQTVEIASSSACLVMASMGFDVILLLT